MDIYDKSPDWKHNPVIVGLLVLFFFPFGLYLVWKHPTWERRTKWIITGIFAFCLVIGGIVGEGEKARIAEKLMKADADWTTGKRAEAVTVYKSVEDEDWGTVADDAKPVILSRIVEFHADAGQDSEAMKWIATANRKSVSLTSSSEKVTTLLKTVAAEQSSSGFSAGHTGSSNASADAGSPKTGYELGKEFTLGDYKYKIISVSKEWRIGKDLFGEFIGETPSPGASFVVVTYTIENCTNESQVVMADDFKLLDSQGRTFDTSSNVSTALTMHTEDKDFLLSQLQPGIPRRMQQGFEVPSKALESEVTLIVPKKGLWSSGDARLTVKVR